MSPETRTARGMGRVRGGSPDLTSRVTETRRLDGLHAADHEGVTPVMMMSFIFITRYSCWPPPAFLAVPRSEEHTSELQSHHDLVCRLLLEKKKKKHSIASNISLTT